MAAEIVTPQPPTDLTSERHWRKHWCKQFCFWEAIFEPPNLCRD